MEKLTTKLIIVVAVVMAGLAFWYFLVRTPEASSEVISFAQCLAENKITMYGAEWCPHCQNEKRAFGSAFQYVPYVECPDNPALCEEKGIKGYPTWIFPDGRKLEGEQGLYGLSETSGCPLSPTLQL